MSHSLVVLTGAGISADSGLSTFRGGGGLWEGHRVEDVATPEAWARDRRLVWRFYQMRRAALSSVEPNAAHHGLVTLAQELEEGGHEFALITQNVDGLHERAGSRPLNMHGTLTRLACERCGHRIEDTTSLDPETFVPCARCGHDALRPDVVWFGEIPHFLSQIEALVQGSTHFLVVGTSGVVYPAAGCLALAREAGAKTWVQALEAPENLDERDTFLPGRAAEVVPRFVREFLDTV